jgi:hypothetical protein
MEREGRMRGPEDWQKGYEGKRVVNAGAAPSVRVRGTNCGLYQVSGE